jgi:UDP-glucose 4-epimerase
MGLIKPDLLKNSKRWLITGGCGLIGTNLIDQLLKQDNAPQIRILDNLSAGSREDLAEVCEFTEAQPSDMTAGSAASDRREKYVELIVGDIRDDATCLACCDGVDVIIHLAANTGVPQSVENPRTDMETNVGGTFNMLEAARRCGVDKFIFASSGAPLGEVDPPIHEELAPHPVSPYGAGKLAGEAYCSAYYNAFGLNTIALRFGNVYGPRSQHKGSVVAKFIKQALAGETLEIYGDGGQTRDYIYIDDLILAIMLSTQKAGVGGEIFQIATSKETTVNELIRMLKDILAQRGIGNLKTVNAAQRKGDVRRNFSDTTKAKRILGWQANIELEDGIQRVYQWYSDRMGRIVK